MTAMKRLLALIAFGALIAAAALTADRVAPPPPHADNHCPVGCLDPDPPITIAPQTIIQQTRQPWVIGVPFIPGAPPPLWTTTTRKTPVRKP